MPQAVADPEMLQMLVEAELAQHPPEAPTPHGKLSGLSTGMLLGGNAADAISTMLALKNPDARETNPIYGAHPSMGKVAAIKGGTALAELLAMKLLAKDHPKAANVTSKILGGLMGGVAASNLSKR